MFAAFMPGALELTVEEGIANGVDEIRKAVRYQIKHGAQLIKVCVSGGVMSLTGEAGRLFAAKVATMSRLELPVSLRSHPARGRPWTVAEISEWRGPRPLRRSGECHSVQRLQVTRVQTVAHHQVRMAANPPRPRHDHAIRTGVR